jgi:hypothetical protein
MEKPIGGIVGNGLMPTGCMCRAMLVKTGVEPIAHTLAAVTPRMEAASPEDARSLKRDFSAARLGILRSWRV